MSKFSLRRAEPAPSPGSPAPLAIAASDAAAAPVILNWPTAAVVITFGAMATVLFALGHPVAAVLGLLGGAAGVAITAVCQITGRP